MLLIPVVDASSNAGLRPACKQLRPMSPLLRFSVVIPLPPPPPITQMKFGPFWKFAPRIDVESPPSQLSMTRA